MSPPRRAPGEPAAAAHEADPHRGLARASSAERRARRGLLLGLLGVLAFSLTLPMTRLAVAELDAWLVAFGRMAAAGLLAAAWLRLTAAARPQGSDWKLLFWSVAGIVIGFPLLSSIAMQSITANRGAVITGALPFATALLAAWWFKERQSRRFWVCAALGSALVIGFALRANNDSSAQASSAGELAMAAAVLAGAAGYVAGGRLAARLGGVNAILWALAIALPLTLPVAAALAWQSPPRASVSAWAAFAYVTLISQIAGFFAWYGGLALGGIGRVGQVQLLQVFFTLAAASLLFGEAVAPDAWLVAAAVVITITIGRSGRRQE